MRLKNSQKQATKKPMDGIPGEPRKAVPVISGKTDKETRRNYAKTVTSPELATFRVINGAEKKSGVDKLIDVPALLDELREQAKLANSGDMKRVEAMLMNQATALQTLFARLAERGMGCDQALPFETNLRIALRAQSQCRATLETLAMIKNPPIVYARQANVTTGPQQVNNGIPEPSRTRENETKQSKQSGVANELLPDGTASQTQGGINPALETLGKVHGAEVGSG